MIVPYSETIDHPSMAYCQLDNSEIEGVPDLIDHANKLIISDRREIKSLETQLAQANERIGELELKNQKLAREKGDLRIRLQELKRELEAKDKENRKLSAAFHQMKNNAKQLFDMSNRFNSSIESNLIMAKDWCDNVCGTKEVNNEDV